MTAYQMTQNRPGFPWFWFLLLLAVVLAVAAAPVVLHDHAVIRHGTDAEIVRRCGSDPANLLQVWAKSDRRYHCIYKLDGAYGDMVVQLDENSGTWHEITSFIRAEGNDLQAVARSLSKEAVKVWPK